MKNVLPQIKNRRFFQQDVILNEPPCVPPSKGGGVHAAPNLGPAELILSYLD